MQDTVQTLLLGQMPTFDSAVTKVSHFFFGTSSSCIINGIIFALFLTGALIVLRGRRLIWKENRCLDRVRQIFQEAKKDQADDLLNELDSASLPQESLVVRAIKDVQNVKSLHGNIETLADSFRSAYVPRSSWGRYIASILIILGLIGTIIGLSYAVINLRGILLGMGGLVTQNAFQEVISEILGSLGFMETAFSTTLCGFGFFLMLSFFDHTYQNAWEDFVSKFESFNSNVLIPFFTPKQAEDSLAAISRVLKASSSGLLEVSGGITDVVSIVSNNQEIYGQMADTLHGTVDGILQAQQGLSEHYRKIVNVTEDFIQASQALAAERKTNQETVERLFQKLGGDKSEIEKLYIGVETSIRRLEESFKQGMVESCSNIKVATDLQNQQIRRIEADHDAFLTGTNQRLLQMIQTAEEMLEKQKESYEKDMKEITRSLVEGAKSLNTVHERFVESLDQGFGKIREQFSPYQDALASNFLKGFDRFSGKVDQRLNEILPGFSDLIRDGISHQERLLERSNTHVEKMKETVEAITRMQNQSYKEEFSSVSADLKECIRAMQTTQKQFISSLQQGFERISRWGPASEGKVSEDLYMIYSGTVNLFKSVFHSIVSNKRDEAHGPNPPKKDDNTRG